MLQLFLNVRYHYIKVSNQLISRLQIYIVPIFMDIDVKRLDEGDSIEATLMRHKTCYLKFNQTKLKRLQKKSVAVKEKTCIMWCTHTFKSRWN